MNQGRHNRRYSTKTMHSVSPTAAPVTKAKNKQTHTWDIKLKINHRNSQGEKKLELTSLQRWRKRVQQFCVIQVLHDNSLYLLQDKQFGLETVTYKNISGEHLQNIVKLHKLLHMVLFFISLCACVCVCFSVFVLGVMDHVCCSQYTHVLHYCF